MPVIENEKIVLLSEDLEPIGCAPKLDSHHDSTQLHLAFSCYIMNTAGEVLVTRRAPTKKTWPGIWSNSCCGHPAPMEKIEDAVYRRANFELGLELDDLQLALPDFRYRAVFDGIVENEYCPVFTAKTTTEPTLNPHEVMDYKWMSWKDLVDDVQKHNEHYSYWSKKQIGLLSAQITVR